MNRKRLARLRMLGNTRNALSIMPQARVTPVITARVEKLDGLLDDIASIEQRQLAPLARHFHHRDTAVADMAETTLQLAGVALSHVTANAVAAPAGVLRVSRVELLHRSYGQRVRAARRLLEALRGGLAEVEAAGITAAQLDQFEAKIAAAEAAILEPRDAVAARRAATESLEVKLREAEALVRDGIDPLIYPLRLTEPEFYRRYRAARLVMIAPATRGDPEVPAAAPAVGAVSTTAAPAKPEAQPLAA